VDDNDTQLAEYEKQPETVHIDLGASSEAVLLTIPELAEELA
jgi:hypothetical protein